MKWNNTAPDIQAIPLWDLARVFNLAEMLKVISCSYKLPIVFFEKGVEEKVVSHLKMKKTELGGLLLGTVFSRNDLYEGVSVIHIQNSVACENFDSTGVSLSMSSNVWQKANTHASGNQHVIGWYHSHPNLGAFFSGTDRRTQKNFFSNSYSIGLVIDPIRTEERWFIGPESIEIPNSHIIGTANGLALV